MNKHLLIFLLWFVSSSLHAMVDPSIQWRMKHTEHFTVIYDAEQEALGTWYAQYAEQAYKLTVDVFGNPPRSRTVIIVDDSSDSANGSAMPVPYAQIHAYP